MLQTATKQTISYPYLPKGRGILQVAESNKYMAAAKEYALKVGHISHPTGSVIVKNDKIIARGANIDNKKGYCPRVIAGRGTGKGYDLCPACHSSGHSEISAVKDGQELGNDINGADLYLYGHWWCCESCWNAMIKAGIKNVYVMKGAQDRFLYSDTIGKVYISGPLTNTGKYTKKIRLLYDHIAQRSLLLCTQVYVPHKQGTDPQDDPNYPSPEFIWKKNQRELVTTDLVIAYVGKPSLGVGQELEIARVNNSDIILWWFKGEKVSRMARGNPAVKYLIEANDEKDLLAKLDTVFDHYRS